VKRENGEKEREGEEKKEGREKWSTRVRLATVCPARLTEEGDVNSPHFPTQLLVSERNGSSLID